MIIAARVDMCADVRRFVEKTNERMRNPNPIKNPFTGGMQCIKGCVFWSATCIWPVFFPRRFFAWAMKKGLRKEGYEGPYKYLNKDATLEVLYNAVAK